ncbi:DNA polymerase delta subunit 3 isoform X2 [Eleginops maclovinus]|uniref:DNA polymerase delta subunit 3 isoform X2 n=1 Tax=Eleginops maclovinus TaxID=56733 RepID=UPI0030807E1A
MDELYLDNIDEYVNDQDKIVTYKWLSLTLGVHVNTAKQMLFHYLDYKRKESSAQLHATYLVSGNFVDNGQLSHKVLIVKEDKLEDFKSKMSLIASVHVYSVQKALLKDSGPLYSVDYDAVKDNLENCSKFSAISCACAVPVSSVELQQTREIQRSPSPEPEGKKSCMNGSAILASKPAIKPQKGIMGMFGNKTSPKNQDNGKEVKSEQKEDAAVDDAPKSKPAAKANPMMNFFGSQAAKKPEKPVKQEEAAPSSSSVEPKPPQPEEKQPAAVVKPKPKDTKIEFRSKTKRVEDSNSEDEKMDKKKRRRIKKPVSESSDEDVIPDSPQQVETREPTPSPKKEIKAVSHSHRGAEMNTRKRRRVLKSRTFLDEEGCIVTEKDYESESYSETEDDFQAAKHAPKHPVPAKLPASNKLDEKKSQKKNNTNKGSKQASIMGFFQKK